MATATQVRQYGLNFRQTSQTVRLLFQVIIYLVCCDVILGDYCAKDKKFSRCICTDEFVECHNQTDLKDITTLYPHIKDNVTRIVITGSNFFELPQNFLGSCKGDSSFVLHNLLELDLTGDHITQIHGKSFHCMPKLQKLTLAHNEWMIDFHSDQTGYFTSLPDLKHLDLTNAFDEIWNGTIHIPKLASIFNETDMTKLETLKLPYNELFSFSTPVANTLCALKSLKTLDLSHNKLSIPALPTVTEKECLEDLEDLDVSYNNMPRLPKEFMDKIDSLKKLKSVRLGHNDYVCNCLLRETYEWLDKPHVHDLVDLDDIVCADGYHSSYINKTVLSLKLDDLQCLQLDLPSNTAVKAVTGVIFTVIGIVMIAFLIFQRDRVGKCFTNWKKRMPSVKLRSRSGYRHVQEVAFVENV